MVGMGVVTVFFSNRLSASANETDFFALIFFIKSVFMLEILILGKSKKNPDAEETIQPIVVHPRKTCGDCPKVNPGVGGRCTLGIAAGVIVFRDPYFMNLSIYISV